MKFRPYQAEDKDLCLNMFDGNVPHFFNPEERNDFEQFLDQFSGPYFVLENKQSEPVGCGGYETDSATKTTLLRWGIISNKYHGQGLGSTLLKKRIARIKKDRSIKAICINTSQNAEGFYQRYGFKTNNISENFFGPNLHLSEMLLEIKQTDT